MKHKSALYWFIGIVIVAIIMAGAFYLDHAVHSCIAAHQTHGLKRFMYKVSRLGDWPEHVGLGLALAGFAWWRGSKKWTRVFLAMLIALAIAGVASRAVKIAAGRARPSVKSELLWGGPRFNSKYHAFPSGHTAASTAFFAVLFFGSWRIGLACLPIPLLISFSRMYVEAHYLSDVVFAAILGVLCALLVARLLRLQIENRKPKIKLAMPA